MGFGQAVSSFWNNYTNFKGRARRSEYWFASLFLFLANIAAVIADAITGFLDVESGFGLIQAVWFLAILIPAISLLARRLHDTNRSGWWILILLVPFVGAVVLFVFTLLDSHPMENRWGLSPKS